MTYCGIDEVSLKRVLNTFCKSSSVLRGQTIQFYFLYQNCTVVNMFSKTFWGSMNQFLQHQNEPNLRYS